MKRRLLNVTLAILVLAATQISSAAAAPRHDFPKVGRYEVLCCDFHMHTINSDGKVTTRERVTEAHQYGYDVISVTDHRTTKSYRVAEHVAKPLGMIVIRGLETGIAGKEHFNAIGVSHDYTPRNPHSWAETSGEERVYYRDQLQRIADDGGVVIYNHPHCGLTEPVLWGIGQGIIQGIEVKNGVVGEGWATVASHGTHCYPFAFDWALEHDLALLANSDVHGWRNGSQPVTLVLVEQRSAEVVMDAVRARRTVAWFDGMLWGREALLRELVQSAIDVQESNVGLEISNNCPVALTLRIGDAETTSVGPYQRTALAQGGSEGVVTVENVWTSPTTNLSFGSLSEL